MQAVTSHQIVGFGDTIRLFDSNTGNTLATATLMPGGGDVWNITADGTDDVSAPTKNDAIHAMIEQARKAMPGYPDNSLSVTVQPGLLT